MNNDRLRSLASQANLTHANQLIVSREAKEFLAEVIDLAAQGRGIDATISSIESEEATEAYVKEAETLLTSGHQLEAELLLIATAFLSSARRTPVARLAELYESQSAYALTVSFAKQLLECGATDSETIYQLAFALYTIGRSDEALEYLLPHYICDPSQRVLRLCGLLLKSLNRAEDAVEVLEVAIKKNPNDFHSIRALSEIHVDLGMYQKALDIIESIPNGTADATTMIYKALIYRFMGDVEASIIILSGVIDNGPFPADALWTQCFNYSISDARHAYDLLTATEKYWAGSGYLDTNSGPTITSALPLEGKQLRIGFLTADIGEHVVTRFLTPLLRSYDKARFSISIFSTARRFEQKGLEIASMADRSFSLQELSLDDARSCIQDEKIDVVIDTNGFTRNSGIPILAQRCAPIQCHYIGYHATTGLETIDHFIGDSVTAPPDFQWQYSENLVQIPKLWMAYDADIEFPLATPKTTREGPVFGAFSQITKITTLTLEYWGAAMQAVPESILVIKDRGVLCDTSRKRVEDGLKQHEIDPSRVYFFGPVGTHLDHLDSYNAIDIALDTTPWSGATTAFEALGMGVPLIAICGDTTSSRMSTSVVSASGKRKWIAHSKDEFVSIAAKMAKDYRQIRQNKSAMQVEMRTSILFDEARICHDFFDTIEQLCQASTRHE